MKEKIAISIGDLNGIGVEIALREHKKISKLCKPYYFIHKELLKQACKKLSLKFPDKFNLVEFSDNAKVVFKKQTNKSIFKSSLNVKFSTNFKIKPGDINSISGAYSFASFKAATFFVKEKKASALVTMPIHKKAWADANISYKGHTQALRDFFKKEVIMMLGNEKLFVALFTEHIALADVSKEITVKKLCDFFINFYKESHFKNIGVLAFNPHASDFNTIGGREEKEIKKAIRISNVYLSISDEKILLKEKKLSQVKNLRDELIINEDFLHHCEKKFDIQNFYQNEPLVADTAFTPKALKKTNRLVSMYHDLALAPLKALYFDESVNISLNLPIIRTSVDHGTAFDIAYKNKNPSTKSYIQAVKMAIKLAKARKLKP